MTEEPKKEWCPECGCEEVTKTTEPYTFPYGHPESVELTVDVPVYSCSKSECGFRWMNWEAEVVIDAFIEQWKQENNK